MSEFVFIMTCWLSGERSLPFGLLVSPALSPKRIGGFDENGGGGGGGGGERAGEKISRLYSISEKICSCC